MARRVAGKKQSDRWLRCRQTDQKRSVLSRGDVRPYLDPGRLVLEVFLLSHPSNDAHVTTYTGQPVSLRFASIAPPRCCSGVRLLCGLTLKRCVLAVGLRAYARDRDGNKVKIVDLHPYAHVPVVVVEASMSCYCCHDNLGCRYNLFSSLRLFASRAIRSSGCQPSRCKLGDLLGSIFVRQDAKSMSRVGRHSKFNMMDKLQADIIRQVACVQVICCLAARTPSFLHR